MLVKLYNNLSETIVVDKNIEQSTSLSDVKLLDACSILKPVMEVRLTDAVLSSNYCYIPKFKRYYYIMEVTIFDNNRAIISCSVDVLMSFKDKIRATKQNIVRSENLYNMYLEDPNFQVTCGVQRQNLNFDPPPGGWKLKAEDNGEDHSYVLNTF